ncbi:MAG: hypothetical protein WA695_01250 [Candidatus Dormiibacterota bacterium]
MADAPPLRYHSGQHFHPVDRQKEIWRSHVHRHPHSPLEWASHDEDGAALDAGHGHSHLDSHPYGKLVEIRQHTDRPPDVKFLPPPDSEKVARINKIAATAPDLSIRKGYAELAAQYKLAEPDSPKVSTPDLVKAAVASVLANSAVPANLARLQAQMDAFCAREGILGHARPQQFIGKSAPNPEADALDRKAEAWAPIDRDASQGYRQQARELRQSGAANTHRRR